MKRMNKFSSFVMANSLFSFLSLLKRFRCPPTLPMAQVVKAKSAAEIVLITLVSKEVVAAGPWVSHIPTSCTQTLFPRFYPLGLAMRKKGKHTENICKENTESVCKINVLISTPE